MGRPNGRAGGQAVVPTPAVTVLDRQPGGGYDVLVLDGATKQSLVSTRSFGRAGLRVAVAECFAECDPALPVVAFRSRHCARRVVLPSFAEDAAAYAAAVVEFVRGHPTRVVLPTMDGSIAALTPARDQLAALGCTLALPPDSVLDVANDKDCTLAVARRIGVAYPKTMRLDNLDELAAMLAEFDFPVVLKPTISFKRGAAIRVNPVEVVNEAEAITALQAFLSSGVGVLAQQWACGRREGVTMFVVDGDIRACCAHVAHRTSPQLGGASVMRESLAVPPDIYAAAVSLVAAIGMEGVCEVEFRRDAQNRPLLMEVNARLAGTIENSVHAGLDFPLMIWQWATGEPVARVDRYKTGVRTRWLRGDMRWLRDNFGRAGRPDSVSTAAALRIFGTEFFRTVHYDCFDHRDLGPAMAELRNTAVAIRKSGIPRPAARASVARER
jgi:predicted ATP-grasp superfamily ATP-dependent carboligase